MVSLVYHRPHCYALGKVVTITADRCAGPRELDPRYPRYCTNSVRCFYMRERIREAGVIFTNPLALPRADGSFEPVDASASGESSK